MGIGHWLTRTIKTSVCGYRAYSDTYIKELRSKGAVIGEDVTIHYPMRTVIDATAPHLITIGNHVNITGPATILTHDYSWWQNRIKKLKISFVNFLCLIFYFFI